MDIITYKTLEELQDQHKIDVICNSNVGDIYETAISFSYRIYDKNGNTIYFKQWRK